MLSCMSKNASIRVGLVRRCFWRAHPLFCGRRLAAARHGRRLWRQRRCSADSQPHACPTGCSVGAEMRNGREDKQMRTRTQALARLPRSLARNRLTTRAACQHPRTRVRFIPHCPNPAGMRRDVDRTFRTGCRVCRAWGRFAQNCSWNRGHNGRTDGGHLTGADGRHGQFSRQGARWASQASVKRRSRASVPGAPGAGAG